MNVELVRAFRKKLIKGPVFGPFSKTCDPAMVESLGNAGFDFIILDMEHGPNSLETVQNLIRAAEIAGFLPIVRTTPGDTEQISKVLDIGAAGVQVPQITCAAEARAALQAARFAPQGMRGVCRFVRAARYSSMDKAEYFKKANEALIILQLEGQTALDNLDEILNVKGMDVVFVGPYDLSQSLGVPGQTDHPLVVEKTRQIVKACRAKKIVTGNFTETPKQTATWIKRGLHYMSFSVDVGILYEAGLKLVSELRKK